MKKNKIQGVFFEVQYLDLDDGTRIPTNRARMLEVLRGGKQRVSEVVFTPKGCTKTLSTGQTIQIVK